MTTDNHPLRKLAASLKTGDMVRAVFSEDDVVITREGPVTLDADRDPVIETVDGEVYHLTLYGIPVCDLSSLEVITPTEPLPVHQVRRHPGTKHAWQKYHHGWRCALLSTRLSDDDVRSWPVMEEVA